MIHNKTPATHFSPETIVLAKGSYNASSGRKLLEQILASNPDTSVVRQLDTPHNQISLGKTDALEAHRLGKKTLVLGVHKSAVRKSEEAGNTCPNYWHLSPYGFCPYGCHYCYLAGVQGVRFSPTVKIYLNLSEILAEIDGVANKLAEPTAFYLGKLQDGLALDHITGYSRVMIPFFANHPYARMTLLTKSANVSNLLDLDHKGHSILSWTVNPAEVINEFEMNTPPLSERIQAMKACASAGYPVRAVVMPVIPVESWRRKYNEFFEELLTEVPLERLTLGGVCIYRAALDLMECKIGKDNAISRALSSCGKKCTDGRVRYPQKLRIEMYSHMLKKIRALRPDLTAGLCLEETAIFEALNLTANIGRCNCVL